MLQKFLDGIVPFLIFCAIVARFLNWIRTTYISPDAASQNVGAEQPAVPRQQPRPKGQRATNDPSSFLPEMTQQGAPRAGTTSSRSRPSNKQEPARGQQSAPRKQQGGKTSKPSPRHVGIDRSPGSGVGAHVDTFIGQHVKSHIGNQLSDAVKTDISDQVRSHLGEDKSRPPAPTAATTHGSAAAGDLLLALRSPQGVRQAILISEVLSKPKALRRS